MLSMIELWTVYRYLKRYFDSVLTVPDFSWVMKKSLDFMLKPTAIHFWKNTVTVTFVSFLSRLEKSIRLTSLRESVFALIFTSEKNINF